MDYRNNGKLPDLLDQLANAAGCLYVSDLHQAGKLPQVQLAVSHCPADRYSISEWTEAVQYIGGQSLSFQSSEEARGYLLGLTGGVSEQK